MPTLPRPRQPQHPCLSCPVRPAHPLLSLPLPGLLTASRGSGVCSRQRCHPRCVAWPVTAPLTDSFVICRTGKDSTCPTGAIRSCVSSYQPSSAVGGCAQASSLSLSCLRWAHPPCSLLRLPSSCPRHRPDIVLVTCLHTGLPSPSLSREGPWSEGLDGRGGGVVPAEGGRAGPLAEHWTWSRDLVWSVPCHRALGLEQATFPQFPL